MGKKPQMGIHHEQQAITPLSGKFNKLSQHLTTIIQTSLITLFTDAGSSLSKLGSFSSTGKSGVQMRRTTNKKGKTAPAPPKRTR